MVVYFGVSLVASAGLLSMILLIKKSVHGILKTGILLVVFGAVIQLIAGFVDSVSHDVYGIDGLISWSHQPLELGLVLAALGGFLVLKNKEHTKLKILIPFSIISFLFFTTWLVFNFALIFGHTIQCIYIHVIFSSGCSIL
jgi:succinate-acetate transporter protein